MRSSVAVDNGEYHHLSQLEIVSGMEISQQLSITAETFRNKCVSQRGDECNRLISPVISGDPSRRTCSPHHLAANVRHVSCHRSTFEHVGGQYNPSRMVYLDRDT